MTTKERFEERYKELCQREGITHLCHKNFKLHHLNVVMEELSNEFFPSNESSLDEIAEDYLINLPSGGSPTAYDDETILNAFKDGFTYNERIKDGKDS